MKSFKFPVILGLLLMVIGCSEDAEDSIEVVLADVIVINEGNFRSGDGTFSTFSTQTDEVKLGVFTGANGFPVAATIQNAVVYDDKIFALTNSPDKLEVMDVETLESEGLIRSGFSNPYSFAAIGDKGYVTNWGQFNSFFVLEGSFIAIVDLNTYTITDSIALDVQPQHVLAIGNDFYVSNVGGNTISVYSADTDQETATITVPSGPDKMVVDANNDLWVICTSGSLVKIDLASNTVETTITGITGTGYNEKMVINSDGDALYYLASSPWPDPATLVYSLNINEISAPSAATITGENYYGIGVSPDNELYIADADAFQGNGSVNIYNLEGTAINSFQAGRGPNGFIFR